MRLTRPQPVAGRGTPIGLPDHGTLRWFVDSAGSLAPSGAAWSLEWWVQAEDRWHVLASDGTARQRLVDLAPVVETRQHIPGGDVVVTQWAVVSGSGSGRVAVEIGNESGDAVAVAAVLRPSAPGGSDGLQEVSLAAGRLMADAGGTPVVLDSAVPPAHMAWPESPGADCGSTLLANASRPISDTVVSDWRGRANGALVWPLARHGVLQLQVTVGRQQALAGRTSPADASATARGWAARIGRRTRIEWPESPLATAIEANRARLLLASGWPGLSSAGEALIIDALASAGFADEAGPALSRLSSGHRRPDAATLWAASRVGIRSPTGAVARGRVVGEAAEAVGRSASRSASPEDLVWAVAGLQAAASLLGELGEDSASAAVARWAQEAGGRFELGLRPAVVALAEHLGVSVPGGGPPADKPRAGGLPAGADAVSKLLAVAALIRRGEDPTGDLGPVLAAAGPTWTGPDRGGGWDPRLPAAWWAVARSLLLDDRGSRLDLLPALPVAWRGQALEVHGLRTSAGRASWALRWHGNRPALLWEVEGEGPLVLAAPGLDPRWSSASRTGEALLQV